MSIKNKVQLIGNVGNTPEITTLDNGKKVAKFSMATNENYTGNNGEKLVDTQWHNIVVWGKTAEIVEKYVPSGKHIAVEGKLTSRSYPDKKIEGVTRYVTEVVVNELVLLGSKSDQQEAAN